MSQTRQLDNVIDGQVVPAASGDVLEVVDPSTGEVHATSPRSGPLDVDAACRAALRAFEGGWRATTPGQRMGYLLRLADAVEANAERLVTLERGDTGKPAALTLSEEIPAMVDQIRFFAGAARMLEGRSAGEYLPGFTSWVRREPVGVIGQVAPWNYPMMMAVWKFAPALAAGNTVVLKPSDTTPSSTVELARIFADILPPGVFNVICGDRDTGAALVAHPIPAMVSITGSTQAGRAVAHAAADTLKRTHLELGGKAPVVVFADADLSAAAEGIGTAGYFNAGQDCTAATRVLVSRAAHDDFVDALAARARQVKLARDEVDDGALYIPPINNARQLGHVRGLVERAGPHAVVVTGGEPAPGKGFFYPPTVVDGVRQDDELIRTEIFGPVITVQAFTDEDEATAWANGTPYGLAASVWTGDHRRALRMSARLDFGCVWVNCHIPLVAEMPHGGFKESGYGKDLSMYSFEEYTRVKHVMSALG
jgi:betaine-aldehyde dehydrogenase